MIVQNLKALLTKQSENSPKKVLVIADNKEFEITGVSVGVDKITLNTERAQKLEVGDSIENQKERVEKEIKEEK